VKTLGILGLGAFGQLMVKHLAPYVELYAYDPADQAKVFARKHCVKMTSLEEAATCDYVVLAMSVDKMEEVCKAIAPHLKKGAIVVDVGSVKVLPASVMQKYLPDHVEIICTHPLFGPQSGRDGIHNQKIAICPVRGRHVRWLVAFFKKALRLDVLMTTPDEHDKEVAMIQGLTHMIAQVLVELEPLPQKMTTKSFDKLKEAVEIVRYGSMELFLAIQCANPYAPDLRRRFFQKADDLRNFLESHEKKADE